MTASTTLAVERRRWTVGVGVILAIQEVVPSNAGSEVLFAEMGGIAVDVEYHVAGVESDSGVGVSSGIVE